MNTPDINLADIIDEVTDAIAVVVIAAAAMYGTPLADFALGAIVSIALGKRVFKGLNGNGPQ